MDYEIKIEEITEHEDGSATISMDLTKEVYAEIFNIGFLHLIRKGLDNETHTEDN